MVTTATRLMTTDERLALPNDGRRRWLIKRELRKDGITIRNRFHSLAMANVTGELHIWRNSLATSRGKVVCGAAGVRLPGEPQTTVGVDAVSVPADVVVRQTDTTTRIEGVSTRIVEILSPCDKMEELDEMIAAYHESGVPRVWLIDPHDCTATIYRPR